MKIYVGTYAKYNDGSIFGEWLDLEDYREESDFFDACRELHDDEADPEFMFQDFDGIPSGLVTECGFVNGAWDFLKDFEDLTQTEREAFEIWAEHVGSFDISDALDTFRGEYAGTWECDRDFAENYVDEAGYLDGVNDLICYNLDYDGIFQDLGVWSRNGHYFWQ